MEITKHSAYDALDPADFPALLAPGRYGRRTPLFDKIIAASEKHYWDPLNKKYIDFDLPWDMDKEYLVNPGVSNDLKTAIADRLDERQKIKLVNLDMYWTMSSLLHGEQGALSLSASLCHVLADPGAQEYAANQAREEARHVAAFTLYIKSRWGLPVAAGPALTFVLKEIVESPLVWKKIVGMQMLIEGAAMGAFGTLYQEGRDPVLKRLCQLVMSDESFHHKFGKMWADRTIGALSAEEHETIEMWAARIFKILLFNLVSPGQKSWIYREVGLDPAWCKAAHIERFTKEFVRQDLTGSTNLFRVLVKTLLNAGIITDKTERVYATYIDMSELRKQGDSAVGYDIAQGGIDYLESINTAKR